MGCGLTSLGESEQLVVTTTEGLREVINGPGRQWIGTKVIQARRSALVLRDREYVRIKDIQDGTQRLELGPAKLFLGKYDEVDGSVLTRPVLEIGEFIKIRKPDGTTRIVHGPAVVALEDPLEKLGEVEVTPSLTDQQYCILINNTTKVRQVKYGPAVVLLEAEEEVVGTYKLPILATGEYVIIRDIITGKKISVIGPTVHRPSPSEKVGGINKLPVLQQVEYCKIRNEETGIVRVATGPCVCELGPYDSVILEPQSLPILQKDEYCKIADDREGTIRCAYGPTVPEIGPYEQLSDGGVQKCPDLSADEFLVIRNEEDGILRNVVGPMLYRPSEFDTFSKPEKIVNLRKNEYIRYRDDKGHIRVERGEQRVIPDPLETSIDEGVCEAINIDSHHAVMVRNTDDGSLELITKSGLFFPKAYQEIIEVQSKIILEKYQTVVCRAETGRFYYASGDTELSDEERGPGPDFFLPPYHEIVKHSWSTDLKKEHLTSELVWKFDSRPSYMNYEFCCRTLDNVALVIDVTFFWRIIDVRSMVDSTADAPGDTCTHARSMIMQEISKIKLMDFLECFNDVIRRSCLKDDFYNKRGVELLSVEVLKFECQSEETNRILQEIIKETCDRLKFKERQRGENEVSMARLEGEIEEEKRKEELVEVKKSHLKTEARIEGEAEGTRIAAFIGKLAEQDGMGFDKAMKIFEMLKDNEFKVQSVAALSQGNAQLYVTPDNVNLNLGTLHNPTTTSRASAKIPTPKAAVS